MYNKKTLSKASAELDKAKAPKKPKDIITDPMGQWKYPGLPTRIPSNDITMKGVGYPVLGVANNGQRKIMLPGADYTFPGADYVDEYPQMRKGGAKKKKTRSLSGTNKIMLTHPLLQNYKNKVYDPNVDYFQDGGMKTVKSKDGTVTNRFINEAGDEVIQVKTKDGKYTEKVIPAIQQHKALRDIEKIIKVPYHQETEEEYDKLPADEKLRRFERTVDVNLGYPQKRAAQVAKDVTEPGNDPVDNIRHPFAGRYTAEAAYNARKKNASWAPDLLNKAGAWVDANALGVGHEATTLLKDKRPWGTKLRESAEDIYNNAVGVNVGLSDRSEREKDMILINKSKYNKIPDGFGEERPFQLTNPKWTDPYDKKQDGGEYIETELTDDEIEEYRKGGYIVEDISVPELNQAQKGIISTKEHTDKKGNKTIKVQKEDGTVYTKVIGKDGKVYNRTFDPKKDSWATDQTKDLYSKPQGAGNYADEFFTEAALLPGTVKGVKAAAPLVKQGLKTLMTAAPAWAPGANLGNFLTAAGGVMGVNEYVDPNSDVRKATKKAYQNPTVNNMTDALYENTLNTLNFSGFGAGAKVKNLKNYLNPKYSKASQIENTFMPNTLIQHPDNSYVLQNNSVKDFGITPEIKNLPTKDVHKFEVTKDEVKQLIDQNLEYLMHPNYIKRRQAVTGESIKKIEKEINKYVENLKKTTIDLNNARYGKKGYGAYLRSLKLLGIPLTKPKILINSSDKFFKTKSDVLHVLDHEIKHALSPVVESDFKALPKYKNYPHLNLVDKKTANSKYHSADHEQQVRFLRMKDYLHNKYGISKQEPISPEDWDLFKNDWNNWLKEEHIVAGNKKVPRGMSDIKGMMELKDPKVTSDALRNLVNKAWVAAPATGMLLMQNSQNKKQKGGVVAELSDHEIQDYINQGYIVEEV